MKITQIILPAFGKNNLSVKNAVCSGGHSAGSLFGSAISSSIFFVVLLLVSSCASLGQQACLNGQWQDIGFGDGSAGQFVNDSLASHGKACAKHGVTLNAEEYRDGHSRGLALFCRPESAYKLAKSEQIYNYVCPAEYEKDFLVAYTDALTETLVYLQGEEVYLQSQLLQARTRLRFFDRVEGATDANGVAVNSFVSRASPVSSLFENQVNYKQDRRIRLRNAFNRANLRLAEIAPELFEVGSQEEVVPQE